MLSAFLKKNALIKKLLNVDFVFWSLTDDLTCRTIAYPMLLYRVCLGYYFTTCMGMLSMFDILKCPRFGMFPHIKVHP